MGKKQQPFFVWYFVVALVVILIVQNFLQSPHLENVTYSQFKSLVKKGLVINPRRRSTKGAGTSHDLGRGCSEEGKFR